MTGGERRFEEPIGLALIRGHAARDKEGLRQRAGEFFKPFPGGMVDNRIAVDIEAVEEEGLQRNVLTQSGDIEFAAEAPHRDLKRPRPAVLLKGNRFAIED